VRRAKLYYLRARRGKAARIAERGREDNRRERVPVTGSASPETEA
jgi:ribosomal L19-like protein